MKHNKAFTLIELSIVIVIIALILGAVASVVAVREAAEVKSFVSDIYKFQIAVENFDQEYESLPGDSDDAYRYFGTACNDTKDSDDEHDASASASNCNGDGDSQIEYSGGDNDNESLRAWQHLNLSGFLEGSYTGVGAGGLIGFNVPTSKRSGVGFYFDFFQNRNQIIIGAFNTGNEPNNAALTQIEARSIDLKLDDGRPGSGDIRAQDGADVVANNECIAGANYNIAVDEVTSCILGFPILP